MLTDARVTTTVVSGHFSFHLVSMQEDKLRKKIDIRLVVFVYVSVLCVGVPSVNVLAVS